MLTRRGALFGGLVALCAPTILRHPSFGRLVPITKAPALITVYVDVGQYPTYEDCLAYLQDAIREVLGESIDLTPDSSLGVAAELIARTTHNTVENMVALSQAPVPVPYSDKRQCLIRDAVCDTLLTVKY
jgi:hypothetical protein